MLGRGARAGLVALLAAALAFPARAERLPPHNLALLLLRVLAYDRNVRHRAGDAVEVLVLYRRGDAASEARRDAARAAFEEVARDVLVSGLAVKVHDAPYRSAADLDAQLASPSAALLFVDDALAAEVTEIARASRERKVLSAAGARELVAAGLAVGAVARGGRGAVVVNLAAAKAEGADLDSALLALSEVLRPEEEHAAPGPTE